jgi:hypothetical protein
VRNAAIHRVSKDAFGECGSFAGSQWIATGYALAMTGVGERARDDNYSNFLNSSTLNPASRTIPPSV